MVTKYQRELKRKKDLFGLIVSEIFHDACASSLHHTPFSPLLLPHHSGEGVVEREAHIMVARNKEENIYFLAIFPS
jgi:hypothetical protein